MKNIFLFSTTAFLVLLGTACTENPKSATASSNSSASSERDLGQAAVVDDESQKTVLHVALGSKDHTTLVAAVQAAEYETVLVNAGPFTVFAPTNEAFAAVDKATLEDLLKPENKAALQDILEYHVSVGGYPTERMQEGQKINQANLKNIVLTKKDGKIMVNGTATILASVPASNGIVHVIDAVLLPPSK